MAHVKTAVIVIILSMILSAVLSYAGMMTIIQTSKDTAKLALDNFVTHNSIEIYDSLKNGHDYTDDLDEYIFNSEISSAFSLDIYGNIVYCTNEQGEIIFKMTKPNVSYEYDNTLKLNTTYNVMIPVNFAGRKLFEFGIPLKVTSYYNLKTN